MTNVTATTMTIRALSVELGLRAMEAMLCTRRIMFNPPQVDAELDEVTYRFLRSRVPAKAAERAEERRVEAEREAAWAAANPEAAAARAAALAEHYAEILAEWLAEQAHAA